MKKILKFGGSSVGNAERLKKVVSIIEKTLDENHEIYVVVSAFQGVTDSLIKISLDVRDGKYEEKSLLTLLSRHEDIIMEVGLDSDAELGVIFRKYSTDLKELLLRCPGASVDFNMWKDEVLSFGELLSVRILSALLRSRQTDAELLDARKVVITDSNYGNAYVHYQKSYDRIREYVSNHGRLQIITGFLGANEYGKGTTLGRSGSDYSASIFGAALNVDQIEIWTDVDGMLTANPEFVNQPISIPELTYEEAMELAHAGAKVIFPPAMIPALYKQIPIVVKNTFRPELPGTRIAQNRKLQGQITVGLSSVSHVTLLRMQGAGMVGVKGINARLFTCLADKGISVMLVSQAFSEHSTCFAVKPEETDLAMMLIDDEFEKELKAKYIEPLRVESDLSLVAVVGEGMQYTPGIAGLVFQVLGREKINVEAIAQGSSRRNISFIVKDSEAQQAIQALHRIFFEKSKS